MKISELIVVMEPFWARKVIDAAYHRECARRQLAEAEASFLSIYREAQKHQKVIEHPETVDWDSRITATQSMVN
jgi:hypothetical protein